MGFLVDQVSHPRSAEPIAAEPCDGHADNLYRLFDPVPDAARSHWPKNYHVAMASRLMKCCQSITPCRAPRGFSCSNRATTRLSRPDRTSVPDEGRDRDQLVPNGLRLHLDRGWKAGILRLQEDGTALCPRCRLPLLTQQIAQAGFVFRQTSFTTQDAGPNSDW